MIHIDYQATAVTRAFFSPNGEMASCLKMANSGRKCGVLFWRFSKTAHRTWSKPI